MIYYLEKIAQHVLFAEETIQSGQLVLISITAIRSLSQSARICNIIHHPTFSNTDLSNIC